MIMSVFESLPTTPPALLAEMPLIDEAQLAAAAFLARYSGRTLESYRADQRQFFQWAADCGVAPLDATRAHLEVYRGSMAQRGLASATIDRRLSTVCGYYRFAHLDGRIPANPAEYVRRPRVRTVTQRWMDRGELASFLYTAEAVSPTHAALAALLGLNGLRVSEACAPTLRTSPSNAAIASCRSLARATSPPSSRSSPGPAAPWSSRSASEPKDRSSNDTTAIDSTHEPPTDGSARSATERTSTTYTRTCCALRSSWPHSTQASHSRDVPIAARHTDPRTTTIYDRRRQNLDRHAAYAVVAFVTSG
jgi:integrase